MHRRFYLTGFLLHFSVLLAVCWEDTFSILASGYTWSTPRLEKYWQKADGLAAGALGKNFERQNPFRITLAAYAHGAGIEAGYGFFAPSIPNSRKLVFEIEYTDGQIEYDLPHVNGSGAGQRLTSLLDQIANIHYEPLRELIVKMLAFSIWQKHPAAQKIRAVFGFVEIPSPQELEHGKAETYNFLYAYEFSFTEDSADAAKP